MWECLFTTDLCFILTSVFIQSLFLHISNFHNEVIWPKAHWLYVWTKVYSVLQSQPESDFRFKRDEMNAAAKPAYSNYPFQRQGLFSHLTQLQRNKPQSIAAQSIRALFPQAYIYICSGTVTSRSCYGNTSAQVRLTGTFWSQY